MADSILDLPVPESDWIEIYSATSIPSETALVIQNKGSSPIQVWIGDTKPATDSSVGFLLLGYTSKDSTAHEIVKGNGSIWVKATPSGRSVSGKLSIQLLDGILPVTQVENEALTILTDTYDFSLPLAPRLKTAAQITDSTGRSAMVSMPGELHIAGKVDDVNVSFQYGVRTVNVRSVETGTGIIGDSTVSTGTGIGTSSLISKNPIRYRAGHEAHCSISVVFGVPEAGVNQYCGFLNSTDAWSVGYQGLDFGAWYIEGSNVNFILQTDFNYDKLDGTGPSGFTIDPQKGNFYRLTYVYGFLPLILEITDGINWHKVHVLNFINTVIEPHLENPSIPIGVKIERTSGTGVNTTITSGSWRGGSVAYVADSSASDYWTAYTVLDFPLINARNNVFTIRNKTTYFGKNNHIVYELGIVTFDSTANKSVAVFGTIDGVLTGNTAFVDLDTINSPLQASSGGTIAGGKRGPATVIKSNGDRRTDVRGTGIKIYPGETFTFEVDPLGAVNGAFSISARLVGRH